ncbi:MAG: DUF3833 domain-containing protein [Aquabacterium sp.]
MAVLALCTLAGLSGCASKPVPSDYAQETPKLDLRTYFNGPLTAHGVFIDRSGRVVKRFTVKMVGSWQGDTGVLEEDFFYSDGSTERRVWTLKDLGNGQWSGTAGDVAGEARGEVAGNAFNWQYTLKLPVDGRVYEVQFDDWMYLMDEKIMLNRAVMSKFGITLGQVMLTFVRP